MDRHCAHNSGKSVVREFQLLCVSLHNLDVLNASLVNLALQLLDHAFIELDTLHVLAYLRDSQSVVPRAASHI